MDPELARRIRAGRDIVAAHVAYFAANLGRFPGELKADKTRVTEADLRLSADISAALLAAFPADDLLSEEALPEGADRPLRAEFCWVLDPVDGTNNYARGHPLCAISLGLLRNGVPAYGFIHDNARNRLVEGGPGAGLLDGGVPAPTPAPDAPFDRHAIVSFHFPQPETTLAVSLDLLRTNPVRCSGSCALNLAYNALGVIDGSAEHNAKVWDIAAACALLAAAGREIRFLDGSDPFPLRLAERSPSTILFVCGTSGYLARMDAIRAR